MPGVHLLTWESRGYKLYRGKREYLSPGLHGPERAGSPEDGRRKLTASAIGLIRVLLPSPISCRRLCGVLTGSSLH
jgi:hypothetical protein